LSLRQLLAADARRRNDAARAKRWRRACRGAAERVGMELSARCGALFLSEILADDDARLREAARADGLAIGRGGGNADGKNQEQRTKSTGPTTRRRLTGSTILQHGLVLLPHVSCPRLPPTAMAILIERTVQVAQVLRERAAVHDSLRALRAIRIRDAEFTAPQRQASPDKLPTNRSIRPAQTGRRLPTVCGPAGHRIPAVSTRLAGSMAAACDGPPP